MIRIISAAAVLWIGVVLFFWFSGVGKTAVSVEQRTVQLGKNTLSVEVAKTTEQKTKGLSNRAGLASDAGMLFPFPSSGYWGFWMIDMHFPIDIIWIGDDLSVVSIAKNVGPDTYPRIFKPESPARYVIEVNAGWADAHRIVFGDKLTR